MNRDDLTVFARDVGGGFGMKNFTHPEWVLMLYAARKLKQPVKWISNPNEDLLGPFTPAPCTVPGGWDWIMKAGFWVWK